MDNISAIAGPPQVIDALKSASARTGAGFDYLYKTALRESGLKTTAKAPTSSASGLFQFIEQTWLATVKEAGPRHGMAAFAGDISRDTGGRYFVADQEARREILALRNDPAIAAIMAGELTAMNRAELAEALGREPSDGELYIGHFLGPGGAARLIRTAFVDGEASAAAMFPAAASANRSIFHDRAGAERSAGDVYSLLVHKHAAATTPAPVKSGQPDEVSPFAGLIAFFEQLFSGDGREGRQAQSVAQPVARPDVAARPALAAQPPEAPARLPVVAYWPAQTVDMPTSEAGRRLFAGEAVEAYRGQAGMVVRAPAGPQAQGSPPPSEPWGGGLFTNMSRAPGPLVLMGAREPL